MSRTNIERSLRITAAVILMGAAGVSAFLSLPLSAIGQQPPPGPPVISHDQMRALSTTIGGARVLPTTRTVPHWFGSTFDPNNGVTYGYNMVGADPNNCSGAGCDATVTVDIIPLDVVVEGESFNGSDVVNATLASPLFALNNYGSTPFGTGTSFIPPVFYVRTPGGVLSQNDAGNQLQLLDATMRAQFNQTGSSSYHLRLNPVVHDAITIVVPNGRGIVIQGPGANGVYFGDVNIQWWTTRIQNLNDSLGYIDPTHLAVYLTKDVLLFSGENPFNCCVFGFHGASDALHGNGNQAVQTFAWATYFSPGLVAAPNGG